MAEQPVSHQLDVYGAWLHLATDRAQWKQLRKDTGLKLSKVNSIGLTEMFHNPSTGALAFAIYLDVESQTPRELLEVTAHEATHVSLMLMDRIGTKSDGTSEPLAYLVGWITAWLWDSCK